jgi:hypothetical protein
VRGGWSRCGCYVIDSCLRQCQRVIEMLKLSNSLFALPRERPRGLNPTVPPLLAALTEVTRLPQNILEGVSISGNSIRRSVRAAR